MISFFPSFSPNRKQNFIGGAEGVETQHAVYMTSGLKYTESMFPGARVWGYSADGVSRLQKFGASGTDVHPEKMR